MSKARIIADYAGTGATSDLATQAELDAAETAIETVMGFQSVPHIIPDVLYPSYVASGTSNKLLDGTTAHSGAFGTAQSDGRKYYYTNIAGSKPIKDPRIGAHFGSQRHKARSIQLLEQETATHGQNVYSIDGREWMRIVDSTNGNVTINNQSAGNYLYLNNITVFIEFTAYFSSFNFIHQTEANRKYRYSIDGATEVGTDYGNSTANSPLGSRYVDAGSLVNVPVNATLGIHTIKLRVNQADNTFNGIELIAQDKFTDATCDYNNDPTITHDANTKILAGMSVSGTGIPAGAKVASVTSSTAFELSASTTGGAVTNGTLTFGTTEISIPAQNVVSYGKKFAIPATAQHYDPFNGFTNGSSVTAYVDTATSLGVEGWKNSSTYYRPYNGGRVVKWIASDGTIKTSVNMMPPNARSIGNSATLTNATAKANASVANNTFYPTMEAGAIDHSQSEVAKTFHWREFGNGSANGNATYADASMLNAADDIAYVMDDGLTSLSADDVELGSPAGGFSGLQAVSTSDGSYCTFIGTGVSFSGRLTGGVQGSLVTYAQNLPYGTHIVKIFSDASTHSKTVVTIDGVQVYSDTVHSQYAGLSEITFHQPKMPPIPEDAVIIADYMLMADYVSIPNGTAGDKGKITKGVRRISASRDHFYNSGATITFDGPSPGNTEVPADGFRVYNNAADTVYQLPYFGTSAVFRGGANTDRSHSAQFKINGTLVTTSSSGTNHSGTQVLNSFVTGSGSFQTDNDGSFTTYSSGSAQGWASVSGINVGQNTVAVNNTYSSSTSYLVFNGFDVASPIHTSSHYQTFETPFLHELVGGDRNMEQTNLVVTPDGKTWDEVTRDVSYMGNITWSAGLASNVDVSTGGAIFDEYRGAGMTSPQDFHQKDFAIAYDRHICLRTGYYCFNLHSLSYAAGQGGNRALAVMINGVDTFAGYLVDGDHYSATLAFEIDMKRGDYFQIRGYLREGYYGTYQVTRIK